MPDLAPGNDPDHGPRWVIRTGIPSIDGMFRISTHEPRDIRGGIGLPDLCTSTSLAIVGPQGAGKSVLAMHIAARYLADCHAAFGGDLAECPRVCYVSTDMAFTAADPMLRRFALDHPNARCVPFTDYQVLTDDAGDLLITDWLRRHVNGARTFPRDLRLGLVECPADDPEALAGYILDGGGESGDGAGEPPGASIAFVDLASRTAGDDWAFVHRLLGVLPYPPAARPRHLVVIDAIEGLETFGGDMDAFGESTLRRARIAKVMRLAIGKCHVVTIVEDSTDGVSLPEEFVSDVVFRLKSIDEHGYLRRTLQIEKARGQSTVRGRHAYVIRSGQGSRTGNNSPNYDDPEVCFPPGGKQHQSYVELFPSLHYASRNLMSPQEGSVDGAVRQAVAGTGVSRGQRRDEGRPQRAGFGIEYLDEMLAEKGITDAPASDPRGLPCSTITALIGDAGTQKTGLGIAFLGQAYGRLVEHLLADWKAGKLPDLHDDTGYREEIERRYSDFAGVPILITTQNESSAALAEYFVRKLLPTPLPDGFPDPLRRGLMEYITRRTICRRLEIHDMPSSVLFAIIKRAIEAGQRVAIGGDPSPLATEPPRLAGQAEQRCRDSWRIRLVIDDLSTIINTYAQVKSDPLFLPFLLYHLRREGPTSLLIDTRAGRPDTVADDGFHTDLRALSDHRIYTWPVREFFGDHRVAIAAIPPIARDHRARVREVKRMILRTGKDSDPFIAGGRYGKGELFVDPVFELYAGLEENKPQLIPLEVRLYGETDACREYASYLNGIFKRTFRPDPRRGDEGDVVISEPAENYNLMRDGSYLKVDTRLDHTLILQIDEFWRQGHTGELEKKYLLEDVYWHRPKPQLDVRDPFHTYRETLLVPDTRPFSKAKFFHSPVCDVRKPEGSADYKVDRVPFLWDFGFMACRMNPWISAGARDPDLDAFWNWYSGDPGKAPESFSWATFLEHACDVASLESRLRQVHVPAFDLAAPAGESISCLVLEMWLSEIMRTLRRTARGGAARLADQLGVRRWTQGEWGLLDLLKMGAREAETGVEEWPGLPGWSQELYKTWLLLVEALDLGTLSNLGTRPGHAAEGSADATAVAVRHWYKTACAIPDNVREDIGPVHYGRLPGQFTTRGDWFLAVAPESRSYPLASRALDLLCSVRGNMRRLEKGVGLPTRRLTDSEDPKELEETAETLRTCLQSDGGGKRPSRYLSYAEILRMGPGGGDADDVPADSQLNWLWRSGLRNYPRHALTWQSWLVRMGNDWAVLKQANSTHWKRGFELYGLVDQAFDSASVPDEIASLESFDLFPHACRELIHELRLIDGGARPQDF